VIGQTYLRQYYSAHRRVRIEGVMDRAGVLRDFWPAAPPEAADRPFYRGDIFSHMILGNLVHTSTVLIRRDRLARAGGFDETLVKSGEDYEFHLRTCFHGPVGFLDAPSILYRYGGADQLTGPGRPSDSPLGVFAARNNLRTVQKWLELGRGRIALPGREVRRHVADSYGWLGEEELTARNLRAGRADLWRSLRLWPTQPRRWALLAFYYLPAFVRRAIRKVWARSARKRGNSSPPLVPGAPTPG
jgi:hypothetical protein